MFFRRSDFPLDAYTTADVHAFLDIPGRDVAMPERENLRISMRVRNLTDAVGRCSGNSCDEFASPHRPP